MIKRIKILLVALIVIVIILAIVIALSIILKCPGKKAPLAEVYGISGTITSVKENEIQIDAIILFTDGTNEIESRKILINENTKITKLEFPEISPEDRDKPITPTETELKISDLKVGDKIDVRASENISDKTEFQAKSINMID